MNTNTTPKASDKGTNRNTTPVDIERPLSIYDLEKQSSGPVYVINNTDGPTRGSVTFQVSHMNGVGHDIITVPPTWLPIDLMTKVGNRQQLVNSAQFKRCLDPMVRNDGRASLILIHPLKAEELLAQVGATEEMVLLKQRENMAYEVKQSNVEVIRNHEGQKGAEEKARVAAEKAGPSTRVVQLMDAAVKGSASEIATLNSLRSMGTLTQSDLEHVLANADRAHQNIITWAKAKMR